jgi:FGGY-family pentulose kinase
MQKEQFVIGIDVGTGSARAGLFDARGAMLATASEPIQMWRPRPEHVEQSSDDIWRAICVVVRECVKQTGIDPKDIVGISFDATCSLVALDKRHRPLAVNEEGDNARNVIVWMDHRALIETEAINAGRHDVLRYVGGRLSPEMETPKLVWLKNHLPQTWERAGQFFDLADYLTWRASGSAARSLCTLVCKWTYLGHENNFKGRWDEKYLQSIGLDELLRENKIGNDVRPMGERLGTLSPRAAKELGLSARCAVGVGIIDAHAGGLGLLGAIWEGEESTPLAALESALALIGGTSNCHMAVSREAKFVPGVWGPYYSAMVPGMWLSEGGQSTAGSAIDFAIAAHPNAPQLFAKAKRRRRTIYELLNDEVLHLQRAQGKSCEITKDLHILPYFLGNRSPNADPQARAIYDGIALDPSISSQALQYYACIQAVAYGTRDIIAAMNKAGYNIDTMFAVGGGTKNPLWLQEHADATGCKIVLPRESEAVLLGSAILAATAAGLHPSIYEAMKHMSAAGQVIAPRRETASYHRAKYKIFRELYAQQTKRRSAMAKF